MMPIEMTSSAQQDESAVAAVRRGDAERYRELVERHERRVFAVAWSRLGDAALAEEAAQEAFIRGYRRLWLLGDGAKFAAWITAIARHAAINLGLRHRRELNKRERWALEQPAADSPTAGEPTELCTPETLRQTLAELPAAHRECLVLFYLEGKSGMEAAAALGISEAALRVRLHRARAAMRERLEEKLEGSLANLRPTKTLVSSVMAAVLASSSAKATAGGTAAVGMGTKIVSVLGKTFLFSWLVTVILLIVTMPFASILWRIERNNFRDADGFRPELQRCFFRSVLWGFPLLLVGLAIIAYLGLAVWGTIGQKFACACLALVVMLIYARLLTIRHNPYQISIFSICVIFAVGQSAWALDWIPPSLLSLPTLAALVVVFCFCSKRPMRMDYSLFLRAAHGLLKISDAADDSPQAARFNRRELLAFARFLGSRFLVSNFRWEANGLALRLSPVRNRFLTNSASFFMPPISRNCGHILLGWNGTVEAHCGKADARDLAALKTSITTTLPELESIVRKSVVQAWVEFRNGNLPASERILGESPDSEVFIVPPARARSTRWWRIWIAASVVLMLPAIILQFRHPVWLSDVKTVSVTEAQVRAFLGSITTNQNPIINDTQLSYPGDPSTALFLCLVLPSTNLFTPEGLRGMHQEVFRGGGLNMQGDEQRKLSALRSAWLLQKAMTVGWIDWNDVGLKPQDATIYFHRFKTGGWQIMLVREKAWSWVDNQGWDVDRINDFTLAQLRWLRDVNSLDLVEHEKLIAQIASVQTLSGTPPGQPPIHDWRDVRGLFFTPCFPALQDTYYSLAALEILGGLDKIDREACIKGILKRHAGKGYFTSPDSGSYKEYHIDGSTRDTIAAFESLRILGALDRVKDLDQWQFRVASYRVSKPDANGVRTLTWDEIEAWVCQQRLGKILRERKENPTAPVHSLLEP
jgi:RNA polymerase sigma factor (sigma-70 family)